MADDAEYEINRTYLSGTDELSEEYIERLERFKSKYPNSDLIIKVEYDLLHHLVYANEMSRTYSKAEIESLNKRIDQFKNRYPNYPDLESLQISQ